MNRVVRKPDFCICENQDADQLRGNNEADQRLCFRYTDSTVPNYLNPKFQASSHLLWMYSPVSVGPEQLKMKKKKDNDKIKKSVQTSSLTYFTAKSNFVT